MEIIRGYKTELKLNSCQRTLCLQHAGCARFAYNWGLVRKQAAYAVRNLVWLYAASSAEIDACGVTIRPEVLALMAVTLKQEPTSG
jgi:hypothetical protein